MLNMSFAVLLSLLAALPVSTKPSIPKSDLPHHVSPTELDDHAEWSGSMQVFNGDVMTLVTAGDTVYAGGHFTHAGGKRLNYVAMWDGRDWSALGDGVNHVVYALEFGSDGMLYAGGGFSRAGDVEASNVARWDGTQWLDVGGGMNSVVQTLHRAPNGILYAGGSFTRAGNVKVGYLAQWDGSDWSGVGNGMNHNVLALAGTKDGTLYAGGGFTRAGEVTAYQIARWDGKAWNNMSTGMNIPWMGRPVWALAIGRDGSLFAGGNFDSAGDAAAGNIARWNGHRWLRVGSGLDGNVHALVVDEVGNMYAGGYFTHSGSVDARHVAKWDGRYWHSLGDGLDAVVHALALSPSGILHAGGTFDFAEFLPASRFACWSIDAAMTTSSFPSKPPSTEAAPAINISPMPVDRSAVIEIILNRSSSVTLIVYDLVGRRRTTLVDGYYPEGTFRVTVDAAAWPAGTYVYRLATANYKRTGMLIIQR